MHLWLALCDCWPVHRSARWRARKLQQTKVLARPATSRCNAPQDHPYSEHGTVQNTEPGVMSSTRAVAKLVRSWRWPARQHPATAVPAAFQLELHTSTDMVENPPHGSCDALLCPGNEHLVGTRLSYFPRGGPCPAEPPPGVQSSWGGMEAGGNMLYPIQTVDGLVTAAGGARLRALCTAVPLDVSQLPTRTV